MLRSIPAHAARLLAIRDRLTVRTQIAVAVGAMTMILIGALAAGAAFVSYRNTENLVNARLASIASITAERLDRFMAVRQQEVQLFSRLEPMKSQWRSDPAALRKTLEQLQATFADFAWIGFASPDGVVLAATGGLLQGKSVAQRPWFQTGLTEPVVHDVHEAALLSALLAQRADGEPYRFVDIALPVRDTDGQVLGVLGAHLNWDWASRVIASTDASNGDRDVSLSVVSRSGKVLLGPGIDTMPFAAARLQQILTARAGTFSETLADGDRLTAFYVTRGHRDYQGLNWIITASQPASVALAAAVHSAKTILIIGAIAGLAGVALAFFIAARVAQPIRAITREADRIGRASGPTMMPRQNGSVEVVQLTRALRSLLRRIGFAEEQTREIEARATENAVQMKDDISKLRRLAETDYLTGLPNRRAFLAAAEDAMDVSLRTKSLAVLMIDIDHFKLINDSYGHSIGDEAIKGVAAVVNRHIKGTDRTARFGGEEFVVLLREVDQAAACLVAERIREAIAQTSIRIGTTQISATVSVGVAVLADSDRDVQDMIERADRGLYQAKDDGRNRTVFTPATGAQAA